MKACALCAAAMLAWLPSASSADETIGVLPIAPTPGPSPALIELNEQLRQALAARTAGVLAPSELRRRMGDAASGASLTETNRAYEAARTAELSGDPIRAMEGLESVIRELESLAESEDAFAQWSRAMLRLAKIQSLVSGKEDQARATLDVLLRSDPGAKIDPKVHGETLAQMADGVRKLHAAVGMRRLTVTAASAGVRVFVNGREVGTNSAGPVLVNLAAGRYRVSGAYAGIRVPAVQVDLGGGDQSVSLDLRFAELLRPAQGAGMAASPADVDAIFSAAGYLHLDTVVTTSFAESDAATYVVGTVYDVSRGRLSVSGVMRLISQAPPPGGVEALATFLLAGMKVSPPPTAGK